MLWTDMTSHVQDGFARFLKRFPHAKARDLGKVAHAQDQLARYLARSHDLTEFEAREEMDNWLFVQSLARDASAVGIDALGIDAPLGKAEA